MKDYVKEGSAAPGIAETESHAGALSILPKKFVYKFLKSNGAL